MAALELFLVSGDVEVSHYMSDRTPPAERETRLVRAENTEGARQAFIDHFEAKTSQYSVYYRVYNVEVHPTIG